MALHLSPKTEALIKDKMATSDYPNPDALIEQALVALDERLRLMELRELVAAGVDDVAQGRVRDFTPQRREELWREALRPGESSEN